MRSNGVEPQSSLHHKLIHFIKLANVHLNHFPKHEKYALCMQIRNCMYDVYNLVTECNKRYHKKTSLSNLDIKHEQLRMMFKVAFDLGYYNYKTNEKSNKSAPHRRYLAISKMIDEIGSMIGGWIKKEIKGELS